MLPALNFLRYEVNFLDLVTMLVVFVEIIVDFRFVYFNFVVVEGSAKSFGSLEFKASDEDLCLQCDGDLQYLDDLQVYSLFGSVEPKVAE